MGRCDLNEAKNSRFAACEIPEPFSTPFFPRGAWPARCCSVSTLFLTCGPSARLDKKQQCRAYQRWLSIMVLGTFLGCKVDVEVCLLWERSFC